MKKKSPISGRAKRRRDARLWWRHDPIDVLVDRRQRDFKGLAGIPFWIKSGAANPEATIQVDWLRCLPAVAENDHQEQAEHH